MATIKDIAKLAGVSQGTVSNVLNGKGNVSSGKILLVQDAARQLGYAINENAKLLRKGQSKTIAVIVPNNTDIQYIDFVTSFSNQARVMGYEAFVAYSQDNPDLERELIRQFRSLVVVGIVSFTSLGQDAGIIYRTLGFDTHNILFVERKGGSGFIGFDYEKAGADMGLQLRGSGAKRVALVVEELATNDTEFAHGLFGAVPESMRVTTYSITPYGKKFQLLGLFDGDAPDHIVTTRMGIAQACRDLQKGFYPDLHPHFFTLSSLYTIPEKDFTKYELDYRCLGHRAAEQVIRNVQEQTESSIILSNAGFRHWRSSIGPLRSKSPERISMLLLDSPPAYAVKRLAHMYSCATNIAINVVIAGYKEINRVLASPEETGQYDILRVGADMLSWDGMRIFKPLDTIDFDVSGVFGNLIDGLERTHSIADGRRYAVPTSPSIQLLFYRKDLFENPTYRALYQEQNCEKLEVPTDMAQFHRISRFFTRTINPMSPVPYGSTVGLGEEGEPILAGTEFLTRYFSYTDYLFQKGGEPRLDSPIARQALVDLLAEKESCGTPVTWWNEAAHLFASGQVAMTMVFTNFVPSFSNLVSNRVGFSAIPGANPLFGGGALGVQNQCRYPEAALQFISWIVREPVASSLAMFGGNPIVRETLTNYEVIDTYPWMPLVKEGISSYHAYRTPSHPSRPFNDHRLLSLIGKEVRACWYQGKDPATALEELQRYYLAHTEEFTNL